MAIIEAAYVPVVWTLLALLFVFVLKGVRDRNV